MLKLVISFIVPVNGENKQYNAKDTAVTVQADQAM